MDGSHPNVKDRWVVAFFVRIASVLGRRAGGRYRPRHSRADMPVPVGWLPLARGVARVPSGGRVVG